MCGATIQMPVPLYGLLNISAVCNKHKAEDPMKKLLLTSSTYTGANTRQIVVVHNVCGERYSCCLTK